MKKQLTLFIAATTLASLASARGAVSYTCAGYEPNISSKGSLSKQSVSFTLISAQDETTIEILNKSNEKTDPQNSTLTVEAGDCEFDMTPDAEFPAYRISIKGSCGTTTQQNIKGTCFFN